jgi:hypothetical protein|nr:MAG TPA: tail tape measure protein [Caudoviricetes sp.]
MAEVGKIQYIIDVEVEALKKGLSVAERHVDGFVGKAGRGAAAIGKAFAVGTGIAIKTLGDIGVAAVKSYADFEQLSGGIETLFKSSSDQMMDYADQAYKTAGLSANQYMETATSFSASLLAGLGGDTKKAAEYANQAIIDMADNANKMGTSMESIQFAYQGFAKQNYTMLDNLKLGYGGTKEEMERLLKDAQKISGIKYNISNFGDITKAIHVIQTQMGITGTTAKEASETISGSLNSTKAAWKNLMTSMAGGKDIDKSLDALVKSAGNVAKNLLPVIKQALSGIVKLVSELAPLIITEIPKLFQELFPPLLQAAIGLTTQVAAILPQLIQIILNTLTTALPQLVDAVVTLTPMMIRALIDLILLIITKLSEPATLTMLLNAGVTLFMALIDAFPILLNALTEALPEIITNIIEFLLNPNTIAQLLTASVKLFMALVTAVPMVGAVLLRAFVDLLSGLWQRLIGLFKDGGLSIGVAISNAIISVINNMFEMFEKTVNFFIGLLNGAIGIINKIPGVNIQQLNRFQIPRIPRMATGGIVTPQGGGSIIYAGDGGQDEWVVPESKMASLIEKLNNRSNVSGDNITINIQGVFATSQAEQRKVAEQIFNQYEMIKKRRMLNV